MPRVVGVDIPNNKRLEIALTYIYGVGRHTAIRLCRELEMDPGMKARDLTEEQLIGRVESPPTAKVQIARPSDPSEWLVGVAFGDKRCDRLDTMRTAIQQRIKSVLDRHQDR